MGKKLMRLFALTMLLVMLAATASAATVTNREELVSALESNVSSIQIDLGNCSFTDNDGNYEAIKITNTVNTTIEFTNTDSNSLWIPTLPFIEFGGANSSITVKNLSMNGTYDTGSAVFTLSGGNSAITMDNCEINLYNSDYTASAYIGSLVNFTSDHNDLILTDHNLIYVTSLGEYAAGTSYNIVKLPYGAANYDETGETIYTIQAGDKNVHNTAYHEWGIVTNGTAYHHTDLQYIPSTSTCSTIGTKAHYYCSNCKNYYYDEYGLQYTTAVGSDDDYNADNHANIVYVGADVDACGNGYAEHYECADCGTAFLDAEGKNVVEYEALFTAGSNHSSVIEYPVGPATCYTPEIIKTFYMCETCEMPLLKDGNEWVLISDWSEVLNTNSTLAPHTMTHYPYKAPTETEDGNEEYYVCSVCKDWYWDEAGDERIDDQESVIIPAGTSDHTHEPVWFEAVAATETAHGYKGHYECPVCQKWFSDYSMTAEITDKDSMARHYAEYQRGEDEPNCVERAPKVSHYLCTVPGCGKRFTSSLGTGEISEDEALWPIGEHPVMKVDAVAPTETTSGNIEFYICEYCEAWFYDEAATKEITDENAVMIPPASHTHVGTKVEAVAPTETTTGNIEYYTCACGKLFTDAACTAETTLEQVTLPVLEHTHQLTKHERVEATTEAAGNVEYYTCACGKYFLDAEGKQETTADAVVIPMIHVHSGKKVERQEPTYTQTGLEAHYICACGKYFADEACEQEIAAESVIIPKQVEVVGSIGKVEADAILRDVSNASASGKSEITVPVSSVGSVEEVELSAKALTAAADQKIAIEFELSSTTDSQGKQKITSVALDSAVLTAALDGAKETDTVRLIVEQNDDSALSSAQKEAVKAIGKTSVVISASLVVGNRSIHDFEGGYAELKIPFEIKAGKSASDYALVFIADDGTTEVISNAQFADGYLSAKIGHFSDFVIVDTNPLVDTVTTVDLPQTGDNSNLLLWMGLLALCLCALAAGRKVRA